MRTPLQVLALTLTLVVSACSGEPEVAPISKVVFISVDTLRADYLGTYNELADFSPRIDEFAAESVVFTDALVQSTSTLPSHTSMLYGLHAFAHQNYFHDPVTEVLLESPLARLKAAGWHRGAIVGGGQLRPAFGFNRDFDSYDVVTTTFRPDAPPRREHLPDLLAATTEYLEARRSESFFLFVHNYTVHYPHFPPDRFLQPLAAEVGELPVDEVDLLAPIVPPAEGGTATRADYLAGDRRLKYAALVRYVDEFIGNLMDELTRLELDDEVLVIFTSDHGDSHGERGHDGHGLFYREISRVPLIVRWPGASPARIDAPVELNDLMPTIFRAAGVEPPYPFMGEDLTEAIHGRSPGPDADRIRISEHEGRRRTEIAVKQGGWSAVYEPGLPETVQLWNRDVDPGETINFADESPEVVARLIRAYDEFVAAHASLPSLFLHEGEGLDAIDPEVLDELRALGYIQ